MLPLVLLLSAAPALKPPPPTPSVVQQLTRSVVLRSSAAVAAAAAATAARAVPPLELLQEAEKQQQQAAGQPKVLYTPPSIKGSSTPEQLALAKHLERTGAKFYGAYWCRYCALQRSMFGASGARALPYVECAEDGYGAVRCPPQVHCRTSPGPKAIGQRLGHRVGVGPGVGVGRRRRALGRHGRRWTATRAGTSTASSTEVRRRWASCRPAPPLRPKPRGWRRHPA